MTIKDLILLSVIIFKTVLSRKSLSINTSSNVEVNNNIVSGSVTAGSVIPLVNDDNAGNKSNIDIANNYYAPSSASQNAISLNRLRDGATASAITSNVVSGDFGSSIALEFRDIDNTVTLALPCIETVYQTQTLF